jgi:hypothetical protein
MTVGGIIGTGTSEAGCLPMAMYFFDFRSGELVSRDGEGQELPNLQEAYSEALNALADAIQDVVPLGVDDQRFAVDVRDELGPVLEVTAIFGSKILRRN